MHFYHYHQIKSQNWLRLWLPAKHIRGWSYDCHNAKETAIKNIGKLSKNIYNNYNMTQQKYNQTMCILYAHHTIVSCVS